MNDGNATLQRGMLKAGLEPGDPSGDPSGAPRWRSRGYLPHFESAEAIQHVTYHLADSLPTDVLARFEDELRAMPPERRLTDKRQRIEAWLDAGHGCCVLREPTVAETVQSSFLHFDGERYRLFAWVVMPNHVHALFQPVGGWTMAKIVTSWKSFTGRRIAAHMDRIGRERQALADPR